MRIAQTCVETRSLFSEHFCFIARQVRQLNDLCSACDYPTIFSRTERFPRQEVWSIVIPQLMPTSRGKNWEDMTFGFWVTCVKAIMVLEYLALEECSWFVFPRCHQYRWSDLDIWGTIIFNQSPWMDGLIWSRPWIWYWSGELRMIGCTRLKLRDLWKDCWVNINSSNACLEHFITSYVKNLENFQEFYRRRSISEPSTSHFKPSSSIVTGNVLILLLPFIFMLDFLSFMFKKP